MGNGSRNVDSALEDDNIGKPTFAPAQRQLRLNLKRGKVVLAIILTGSVVRPLARPRQLDAP